MTFPNWWISGRWSTSNIPSPNRSQYSDPYKCIFHVSSSSSFECRVFLKCIGLFAWRGWFCLCLLIYPNWPWWFAVSWLIHPQNFWISSWHFHRHFGARKNRYGLSELVCNFPLSFPVENNHNIKYFYGFGKCTWIKCIWENVPRYELIPFLAFSRIVDDWQYWDYFTSAKIKLEFM